MAELDIDTLVSVLRELKQDVFNDMVEGNSPQPAEVVDSVVYKLRELMPRNDDKSRSRLYSEVINFYPDYTPDD